jgi:cell wall-associated NlpC family hydrolase
MLQSVLLAALLAVNSEVAQFPPPRDTVTPPPSGSTMLGSQPPPPELFNVGPGSTPQSATMVGLPTRARQSANPWAAIAYAKRQIGRPYQWGGIGNPGFDCSGLVMKAWMAGGVSMPRTTYQMARYGRYIPRSQLIPSDLVFSNKFGHVQMYLGDGRVIEAARPGTNVRISWLPAHRWVNGYMRVHD